MPSVALNHHYSCIYFDIEVFFIQVQYLQDDITVLWYYSTFSFMIQCKEWVSITDHFKLFFVTHLDAFRTNFVANLFPIKAIALPCLISQQVSHIPYYTSYVFLDLNRSFVTYLFLLLLFMLYFSATRSQSSWCWYNTLLLLFNLVKFAFCIKILVTDTIWQSFQYCIF